MLIEQQEDGLIIVDRTKIDADHIKKCGQNLDEFEQWLFSGAINPVAAQQVLERYYAEMPF